MKDFEIKTYSKKELALMYFPDTSDPRIAVNHLMSWVKRCTPLMEELMSTGYQKNSKYFSPRQVGIIVNYIGEP